MTIDLRSCSIALASLVLLAGCSVTPAPVITPTSTPQAVEVTPPVLPEPPLGVVGSGTLAGFPFEVISDGTDFFVSGLHLLDGARGSSLHLSPEVDPVGTCIGGYHLSFGVALLEPDPQPNLKAFPLFGAQNSGDPTFLHGISQVSVGGTECFEIVIESSEIAWTMQPFYQDLVVTDSGETGGARGVVALEGAVPVTYVVRQGDVFAEVAARFGVSEAELFWLNPRRNDTGAPSLVKDETLNLSPTGR